MAESELQQAKKRAEILAIERRARLDALSDYIGFVVVKLVGFAVTVQVVETEITPLLAPSERWRGVETGPLHHVEPLHTLW